MKKTLITLLISCTSLLMAMEGPFNATDGGGSPRSQRREPIPNDLHDWAESPRQSPSPEPRSSSLTASISGDDDIIAFSKKVLNHALPPFERIYSAVTGLWTSEEEITLKHNIVSKHRGIIKSVITTARHACEEHKIQDGINAVEMLNALFAEKIEIMAAWYKQNLHFFSERKRDGLSNNNNNNAQPENLDDAIFDAIAEITKAPGTIQTPVQHLLAQKQPGAPAPAAPLEGSKNNHGVQSAAPTVAAKASAPKQNVHVHNQAPDKGSKTGPDKQPPQPQKQDANPTSGHNVDNKDQAPDKSTVGPDNQPPQPQKQDANPTQGHIVDNKDQAPDKGKVGPDNQPPQPQKQDANPTPGHNVDNKDQAPDKGKVGPDNQPPQPQ